MVPRIAGRGYRPQAEIRACPLDRVSGRVAWGPDPGTAPMRKATLVLPLAALGIAAYGGAGGLAGASPVPAAAAPGGTTHTAGIARGTVIRVGSSQFGRIVLDRRGQALYLFTKERGRRSRCYDACARAWPPLLTRGTPRAIRGADPALIGTTRRRGGKRQVTYAGHPLYRYVADSPGRILCQDVSEFGGRWLVVKPDGTPVR